MNHSTSSGPASHGAPQVALDGSSRKAGHGAGTAAAGLVTWIRAHPRVILVAICVLFYLPGLFSLPPLDRDESRFAQASKQMLETNDFVNIRFLDGARNKKPAGIHWMQAAVASLAGGPEKAGIWAYRLPSLIGAIIAVLLLHWAARRIFDPDTALLAAALLGACMSLVAETNISKTDGVLLATIVAMNGVLAHLYLRPRTGEGGIGLGLVLLFWVALSVSLLVKGPIGPMVIGLTILALGFADRDWRWLSGLRPGLGFALTCLLVLPWAVAIFVETGGQYYQEAVGKDLAAKVVSAQESHGAPPGYYLALVTLTFFPGSLLMWPALARAWSERADPALRFCLAWLIPTWIAFECFPTKLPHYSMPTYPALALLTAAAVMAALRGRTGWLSGKVAKANIVAWTLLGLTLAAAATAGPMIYGDGLEVWSLPLSGLGVLLVLVVAVLAWSRRTVSAMGTAIAAALVLFVSILEITLPNLDRLAVSPRLTALLEDRFGGDHRTWPRLASTGFVEPSLVFLTRTDTRLVKARTAAEHLEADPAHIAFVEQRSEKKFRQRLAELGLEIEILGSVEGHNYSNGRDVVITLYRRAGDGRSQAGHEAGEKAPVTGPET